MPAETLQRRIFGVKVFLYDDANPDLSYLSDPTCQGVEYAAENLERLSKYGDQWSVVGVRAEARVGVSHDGTNWQMQELTSSGLWGIETDSDRGYFQQVATDELADLGATLRAFGFELDPRVVDLSAVDDFAVSQCGNPWTCYETRQAAA